MKTKKGFFWSVVIILSITLPLFAQKSKPKQLIFAVVNKGQSLEPIAQIENGKLSEIQGTEDGSWQDFVKTYYKPKTTYNLIFGGTQAGRVVVNKAPGADADCNKNIAQISTQTTKAKLGGMVMGLATNGDGKTTSGLRRSPTAAERAEIEKLVRSEFTGKKVSAAALKTLRSHNLTALDVDGDGQAEMIGTYWVAPSNATRGLLFFIAEKNKSGNYTFPYSEYKAVKNDDVMSGDVKDLDSGVSHELLLDAFDTDGDGKGEIFTVVQAFEGNNFHIYKRGDNGKWARTMETYNYHCAY